MMDDQIGASEVGGGDAEVKSDETKRKETQDSQAPADKREIERMEADKRKRKSDTLR